MVQLCLALHVFQRQVDADMLMSPVLLLYFRRSRPHFCCLRLLPDDAWQSALQVVYLFIFKLHSCQLLFSRYLVFFFLLTFDSRCFIRVPRLPGVAVSACVQSGVLKGSTYWAYTREAAGVFQVVLIFLSMTGGQVRHIFRVVIVEPCIYSAVDPCTVR